MPTWNFVRDSLVVAALVVVLAGALALTASLILAHSPGGGNRPIPSPLIIAAMYLLGIGLLLFLRRSQSVRPQA